MQQLKNDNHGYQNTMAPSQCLIMNSLGRGQGILYVSKKNKAWKSSSKASSHHHNSSKLKPFERNS
jgi:hypothetical protein